jgi:uncharacterized protein (DUF302 family)
MGEGVVTVLDSAKQLKKHMRQSASYYIFKFKGLAAAAAGQ